MKSLILFLALLSTNSVLAMESTQEAIHCEKPIFLSDARSILDLTLTNDQGQIFFGKLKNNHDQINSYNPTSIAVKKIYQDAKRIEIVDQADGTVESERFKLVLKFNKLITAEIIEFIGDVDSPKKKLNKMTCKVQPIRDAKK